MSSIQIVFVKLLRILNSEFKGILIAKEYKDLNSAQDIYDFTQMEVSLPLRANRLIRRGISKANLIAQESVKTVKEETVNE
ncbi:MAG: hypothetical protein JNL36_07805 [Candidatus Kapabacteria bacterium]|nr:hypothetical protein [Candidatus Kapabacteria bacterium]